MGQKRYTLSLPDTVHDELTQAAERKGLSLREFILKSIKLGLISLETDEDRSKELIIKEGIGTDNVRETKLILI